MDAAFAAAVPQLRHAAQALSKSTDMARTNTKHNTSLKRANLRSALILGAIALGFFIYILWRGL